MKLRLPKIGLSPRLQKILPWAGYPIFYLFALAVFSYFTAPYDRIRYALLGGFNSADTPLRLELDELSWSWRFPGIAGSDGRLVPKSPPPTTDPKAAPPEYPIEDFYVTLAVFPLLVGTTSANFGIDAFGGAIAGSYSDSTDELELEAELRDLQANQLPYLAELVGLPVSGTMLGTMELTLPEGQLSKANGSIKLDIEDLIVGDGVAKVRGTIALPKLDAGVFALAATIEEGRVTVEEFTARGTDIELVADGKIRLLDKPETSLVEMNLRFKFSDKYRNQSDMTKALFGSADSKVPGVFDLDPKIKQARRDDGFYAWRLSGPMNRLQFQPASAPVAATTAAKKSTRGPRLRSFAQRKSRNRANTDPVAASPPAPVPEPMPPPLPMSPPPPEPMMAPEPPPPPPVVAPLPVEPEEEVEEPEEEEEEDIEEEDPAEEPEGAGATPAE